MKKLTKIVSQKKGNTQQGGPGSLGRPLEVLFTAIAVFLISQILAGIIAGLLFGIGSGKDPDDVFNTTSAQFVFVLLAELLAVWSVIWLVRRFKKMPLASIGLGRRPSWRDLKYGLSGFGIYYLVVIIVMAIATLLDPSLKDQTQDVGFNEIKTSLDRIMAFSSLVLLAPIGEEVVMRGYLYSGLRAKMKYLPALLITSVVFGLAHLEFGNGKPLVWAAALTTFILSIVLVRQREKTGAIYAPILIHMLNNMVAFIVTF